MQWLRMRPWSPEELDEVDWRGKWIDDEDDYAEEDDVDEDRPMEDFDPVSGYAHQLTSFELTLTGRTWGRATMMMKRRKRTTTPSHRRHTRASGSYTPRLHPLCDPPSPRQTLHPQGRACHHNLRRRIPDTRRGTRAPGPGRRRLELCGSGRRGEQRRRLEHV